MIKDLPLPVKTCCELLKVSTSGYYNWKNNIDSNNSETDPDFEVRNKIKSIAEEFPKYGYRRIYHQMKREKIICNAKRIRRIMKEENLCVKRKKYKPITTQSNHDFEKPENLIKGLKIDRINQVWVTDITYVPLGDVFLYLALIMDVFSRQIIGWDLSRNPDTQLTLNALNRAVKLRGKENLKGCIHHSDHGVQYACNLYVMRLDELEILPSMGEVGNSYDNPHAESLNKSVKNEEVWMNEYESFEMAYKSIERFIEIYNKKRLHSSIGYTTPIEFEKKFINRELRINLN